MALPSCRRCGESDPNRMVGLMTLWFGPFIELEPAHGYFYLCPTCYEEFVAPELEDMQKTLAKLNPSAAAYLERERELDLGHGPVHGGSAASAQPSQATSGTPTAPGSKEGAAAHPADAAPEPPPSDAAAPDAERPD